MASPDLLWLCVRKSSSFIRKATNAPVMTAEPGNLCGLNSFRFSGLANKNVVGLDAKITGKKESIILTTKSKKTSRSYRPSGLLLQTGIKKGPKKGIAQLKKVMEAGFYRQDLMSLALAKYSKIKRSFKKKKLVVNPAALASERPFARTLVLTDDLKQHSRGRSKIKRHLAL
eukprot:CAMPEP_0115094122 /NCGR_PEP_ID=MMETSP0227-20121206/28093_1 /TAXON_ID=89957 /ORGANISM="Polarella glacialis, Strain CCMP 1383" /LENGTH=171 /DNA_ID=CAMNT_0002486911 /DNA_START=61 /DNA_END=574 /DNA_ORIENTATION=+